MTLSQFASQYPASEIRRMFAKAANYDDVVFLTIGEPDFHSESPVKEVLIKSVNQDETHYGPNAGEDFLRQAIAEQYQKETGLDYQADQVMISFGGTEALLLSMLAVLDPGDEIIITDPHYPNYLGQLSQVKADITKVPLSAEDNFILTADRLAEYISDKTKMLLINSPQNPTGAVIPKEEMEKIGQLCLEYGVALLSDEVYDRLVYTEEKAYSAANLKDLQEAGLLYVVNSFSKTYAMTGYRVGYVLTNAKSCHAMTEMREGVAFAVPTFIQRAAHEALISGESYIEMMRQAYYERRQTIFEGLAEIPGFKAQFNEATFYSFVDITAFGMSSMDFTNDLLDKVQVAVSPGSSFGQGGEGFIRLSLATSEAELHEALKRFKNYQKTYHSYLSN